MTDLDYSEFREPVSSAGVRRCRTCGSEAGATSAVWLAADLVLGTWPRQCDCPGLEEMTMVVVPSCLIPRVAPDDADRAQR